MERPELSLMKEMLLGQVGGEVGRRCEARKKLISKEIYRRRHGRWKELGGQASSNRGQLVKVKGNVVDRVLAGTHVVFYLEWEDRKFRAKARILCLTSNGRVCLRRFVSRAALTCLGVMQKNPKG